MSLDLREWVNSGLMTFFFFVVGLEARREFDLGELRERRRFALPLLAGLGGMAVAVAIYLLFNAGRSSAHGWGVAMSTDTAFALGLLALVGPRFPDRLRAFMLTVVVVDDIVALVVIAIVYTDEVDVSALLVALGLFGVVLVVQGASECGSASSTSRSGRRSGSRCSSRASIRSSSGSRSASSPTPTRSRDPISSVRPSASASSASSRPPSSPAPSGSGSDAAVSPNERLQLLYHPWTSYVIVPLFALANAGIAIDGAFLARAFTSPITLGILVGYVVGKPVGIVGSAWLRDATEPRAAAAARRLGGRGRRRHDRRHRLHRLAARRDARVPGAAARGGEARHPERRARRIARSRGCSSVRRRCFRAACGSARCSARPSRSSTSTSTSTRSATTSAARRRRAGDGGRVRRLRVPVLRAGRAGRARAPARLRRRPLRLAAPAAQRRPPATPSSPQRRRRRRPSRGRSGRCTTCCSPIRTHSGRAT